MIPQQITFLPVYLMFSRMKMLKTFIPLILPFITNPFGIFMLRQYFMQIPQEVIEAARLDDVVNRKIMFNQDLYNVTFVRDFMTTPPTIVDVTDSMDLVMKKFEDSGAWNLPLIEEGRYIGFVSKAKIFNTYRRVLQHFSDE